MKELVNLGSIFWHENYSETEAAFPPRGDLADSEGLLEAQPCNHHTSSRICMYVRPALQILQWNDKYLQIVNFTGKKVSSIPQ